eukprot:6491466-Amphidinium_carterae.4
MCVKTKGQPTHHHKGALKEQSMLHLAYACINAMALTHKKWQAHVILTGVESTTGLCLAMPTTRKGPTRFQLMQLKKFVMENGFEQTIIQVDNEPAILQLA